MVHTVNELADKGTHLLEELERDEIRLMMRDAYSCASKCSSNLQSTKSDVDRCISKCFGPFERAQSIITNEMNSFQDRLQRCGQNCEDITRDKYAYNADNSQMNSIQDKMEECISKCCEDHVDVLHKTMDRIKLSVKEIRPPSAYL